MSADDDELRSFVRRAMRAAVPSHDVESRALAGVVARARGDATGGDREAAAMVAAAAQELSPGGAAIAAGAATPSLVKIVVAVVIAGAAGTVAWRSSNDTRSAEPTPIAVAPRVREPVVVPTPAELPTRAPIVAPAPTETIAPSEPVASRRERASAKPTPAIAVDEDTLVAETELVGAADRALARGNADEALALAADHARRFADGQLALERRAIELSARCVLQRTGARDDAAAFLRTHADTSAAAKVRARCSDVDSGGDP